jgi:methylenetetrahydrofolate--tRNA-(uracil-5-)-methyltransferase
MTNTLHIIGGGMAGSEAAWQAAEMGVPVVIHEMRPKVGTFAHRTGHLRNWSVRIRSGQTMMNAMPWDCCIGRCAQRAG